jgi:hypothetical protein
MSFWCIYEATLISEGSGQNNQPAIRITMKAINSSNWREIKCGTVLSGSDGKLWVVVYRDAHHGVMDVAPNGAVRGREARIAMQNSEVVVQGNWSEARRSLGGYHTSIAAA